MCRFYIPHFLFTYDYEWKSTNMEEFVCVCLQFRAFRTYASLGKLVPDCLRSLKNKSKVVCVSLVHTWRCFAPGVSIFRNEFRSPDEDRRNWNKIFVFGMNGMQKQAILINILIKKINPVVIITSIIKKSMALRLQSYQRRLSYAISIFFFIPKRPSPLLSYPKPSRLSSYRGRWCGLTR